MALPNDIKDRIRKKSGEGNVQLKSSSGDQVVIEGKTAVPFGSFVKLILKRKVQTLFKNWQEEPIIFSSELLTSIANTPEDTKDKTDKITLTAFVIGICTGVFLGGTAIVILSMLGFSIGQRELVTALGVILVVGIIVLGTSKSHAKKRSQKLTDMIEQVADVFAK